MPAPHVRQRRGRQGIALATTLIFLMVLFIGATALGTISINNLTLRKISSNSVVAMQAAEAGLAVVQARLNATPTLGQNNEQLSGTLSASNASWVVQFSNSSTPGPFDSVNNLTSSSAVVRSDGTKVPGNSVDIIVSTNVMSPNRNIPKVGCLMTNTWTTAVATSGSIISKGALQVYGASTLGAAQQILQDTSIYKTMTAEQGKLDGKIAANSVSDPSVQLGNNSYFDSLMTPGTPDVPSNLESKVVYGTAPVPKVTWAFYTPTVGAVNVQNLDSHSVANQLAKSGSTDTFYVNSSSSVTGGLTLNNCTLSVNGDFTVGGQLTMINSTLYVNGNLKVNGGIKDNNSNNANCTGSIFVCGTGHSVTINGSSQMSLDPESTAGGYTKPQVAIYSSGNINMSGQMTFEGVLYSDGDISINGGVNLVGLMIANGDATTEIDGSGTVVYCSPYAQAFAQSAQLKMMKLSWRIIDTI